VIFQEAVIQLSTHFAVLSGNFEHFDLQQREFPHFQKKFLLRKWKLHEN
jgi:hypothetical protein